MKKDYTRFLSLVIFFCLIFMACSSKIDHKKIIGNWKTINNEAKNTEISFFIADSTIISEFYFDNGTKRVLLKYKIKTSKKDKLIIETTNPSGVKNTDTLRMEDSLLKFSTDEGKSLLLMKYK